MNAMAFLLHSVINHTRAGKTSKMRYQQTHFDAFEIHYTPKHGSWLNIAEIELSFLSRQCLDRRVDILDVLNRNMSAWSQKRNASHKGVDWQFTAADARIKLKRLYPIL